MNGSFESKIQKKLKADKELLDRVQEYKTKAMAFFNQFLEVFGRSDKKSYKDNLAMFFATAETCIDYVNEPYTKYEERPPDKWNDIMKAVTESGDLKVLTSKEETTALQPAAILVEQMRSKPGGQLIEIEVTVAEKVIQVVICELSSGQWNIIKVEDKA